MNFKMIATAAVLACCTIGAQATATKNVKGSVSSIGTVDYTTDYLAGVEGTVTWTVPAKQGAGSYDVFTDVYTFSLASGNVLTASAQVGKSTNLTLKGGTAELFLYEGVYSASKALNSTNYKLLDQEAFTTDGYDLVSTLNAGNYFYVIEGTTSGSKGGKYTFEVTAIPEPANAALLLAGLGLFGVVAKRRKLG